MNISSETVNKEFQLYQLKDNSPIAGQNKTLLESSLGKELIKKNVKDLGAENNILNFGHDMESQKDIETRQYVIQHWIGNGSYYGTANLVGVLGKFDSEHKKIDCLTITTRFGGKANGEPSSFDKDYLFSYLVSKVLHVNVVKNLDFTNSANKSWQQILIMLFPFYLHQALAQGVYKAYMRREYDDSRPKGVIDIPRYIRDDIPFSVHIAYSTRPFDVDNNVTELIRHTIEYIAGLGSFGHGVLNYSQSVRSDASTVRSVTPRYAKSERRDIVSRNLRHPVDKPYFYKYRILQRICIAILQNRGFVPEDKRSGKIFGVLFDCSWLWEEYLNLVCHEGEMEFDFLHPRNKAGTNAQYFFEESRNGQIFPDFLGIPCDRNLSSVLVADAKYKPENNVGGQDYQQLLSYMFRFEAVRGQYWYPLSPRKSEEGANVSEKRVETLTLWSGVNGSRIPLKKRASEIIVHKIGFLIPQDATDYADFKNKMKKSEDNFRDDINEGVSRNS